MSESEYGMCDICGIDTNVSRKYYHYPIICDCCSTQHFEIVRHCSKCEPKPPKSIRVVLKPIKEKDV